LNLFQHYALMSIHEEEGRLLHDMFFHKLPVR
jgi:hypothetical protein